MLIAAPVTKVQPIHLIQHRPIYQFTHVNGHAVANVSNIQSIYLEVDMKEAGLIPSWN